MANWRLGSEVRVGERGYVRMWTASSRPDVPEVFLEDFAENSPMGSWLIPCWAGLLNQPIRVVARLRHLVGRTPLERVGAPDGTCEHHQNRQHEYKQIRQHMIYEYKHYANTCNTEYLIYEHKETQPLG